MGTEPLSKFRCLRKCAPWPYYPGEVFGVTEAEARTLPREFFVPVANSLTDPSVTPQTPQEKSGQQAAQQQQGKRGGR